MSIEYFIFIFVASLAVIQIASARNNLKFLLFLRNRTLSFILAFLLVGISYYWFFYLGGRQVRNVGGNKQLLLFPQAVLAAIIITFIISSLINASVKNNRAPVKRVTEYIEGVELLKEMTWWQALRKPKFSRKG